MTNTPELERVARAICAQVNSDVPLDSALMDRYWPHYAPHARAALQTLLPVSEDTAWAMEKRWRSGPDFTIRDAQKSCFQAAINHIIGEGL